MSAAKTTKIGTDNPMEGLRARLAAAGVDRSFLDRVVLPSWWDDSLAEHTGGLREAAGYICAHLGFSLQSLLTESGELAFSFPARLKHKKAQGSTKGGACLVTHYALNLARAIALGLTHRLKYEGVLQPDLWRRSLLRTSDQPWVSLRDVLNASWMLGVPVIQLRNTPAEFKKFDAVTAMIGDRPVIVLLNERTSPAWTGFIVAHELGHIHHGHVPPGKTVVDEKVEAGSEEKEERAANDFASLLLTGRTDLGLHSPRRLTAPQLAKAAQNFGKEHGISPGVVTLNYGFTTGFWPVVNEALPILEEDDDAGGLVKAAQEAHLRAVDYSDETWDWITRATSAAK